MAPSDSALPPVQFGPFVFDHAAWRLTRDGAPVVVQDKVASFLAALLERPGALWTREALSARLWPGVFVTEDSLFQVVRKGRAALGDDPKAPRWIETVQGRGYRFLGVPLPVSPPTPGPERPPAAPPPAAPRAHGLTGRDALLDRLQREILAGPGLWTFTGPGGVGKTSLALALAEALRPSLSGGVWICDASELRGASALAVAMAQVLGVTGGVSQPDEALAGALEGLGAAALVVDNLEQLAEEAGGLLGRWLERAPSLRILATSRIRLGARGERLVEVPPLPNPDPDCDRLTQLGSAPAGALLLARVAQLAPRAFHDEDAPTLARLLDALGGLPLAIELAAPRLRLLSPAQLLERMGAQLDVLKGSARDRPARHSALRTSIAASWSLLDDPRRAALMQLAQLSGPFPAEAGEAALDLTAWPGAPDPLDMLAELQDHSMIRRREEAGAGGGPDLLEILPSIRDFARERAEEPTARQARQRIDAWYAAPERFDGPEDVAAVRAWRERASLREALHRALARGDAGQAEGLARNLLLTLRAHGPLSEAAAHLRAVAALPALPPERRAGLELLLVEVHLAAGTLHEIPALLERAERDLPPGAEARGALHWLRAERTYRAGQLLEAQALTQAALQEPGVTPRHRARLLLLLGTVTESMGRSREALEHYQAALRLADALGLSSLRTQILLELGWAWFTLGDLRQGAACWEAAREHSARIGDRLGEARALERLGQGLLRQGRLEEAEAQLLSARALFRRGGFPLQEGGCQDQLAKIAMHQGRVALSERRFLAGINLLERWGLGMAAAICRANFGTLYARMGLLDEAHRELLEAWERQRALGGNATIVLHNLGKVDLLRGDLARARARVRAALEEHEADGRRAAAAFARTSLGQVALAEDQLEEARAALSQAAEELRATGDQGYGLGSALGLLGLAEARLGALASSELCFQEAEDLLARAGLPEALALAQVRRGRAAAAGQQRARARAALERGQADLAKIGLSSRGELGWELSALARELGLS